MTIVAIAETLGVGHSTIHNDLTAVIANYPRETAEEYRIWATLTLKRLLQQVYPTAVGPLPKVGTGPGEVAPEVRAQAVMAKMAAWEKARGITLDIAELNGARAAVPEEIIVHAEPTAEKLGDVMRDVFGRKPALPAHLVKQDGVPASDVAAPVPSPLVHEPQGDARTKSPAHQG